MNLQCIKGGLLVLLAATCTAAAGANHDTTPEANPTPPRLSFIDASASFWRPGAENWAPARLNTPLTPGDELYAGERANLEIQIGARAFVRVAEKTQVGLVNLEPDFMQMKLTAGQASVDLRALPVGFTFELDTPHAVFTIEHPGYYRAEVADNATHFITRRGGHATVTTADGQPQNISPSEEIVVHGTDAPVIETYVAPELDAWDRWNYARTDHAIEAVSARYVSPGIYGVDELDRYGTWRVVPSYGPVWVPDRLAPGWVPYSTGSWVWDPYYGWTWIDDAPWGWAPFHYGRWVFVDPFWAWAPGPVIPRSVYAPALVAFFGIGHGVSVRIGIGTPAVGWVALGWGEPLYPWWGRPGFMRVPWWGGWGGPRVVNKIVIQETTAVNVQNIIYEHSRRPNAVVAVHDSQFGKGPIHGTRLATPEPHELTHVGGALPIKPGPTSLVARTGTSVRPPEKAASRSVLATRPPREATLPWQAEVRKEKPIVAAPAPRFVAPPKQADVSRALPRPSFGNGGPERARRPSPPRLQDLKPARPPTPKVPERAGRAAEERATLRVAPPSPSPRAAAPKAGAPRTGRATPESRALPGRPANGLYPREGRGAKSAPQRSAPGDQHPKQGR